MIHEDYKQMLALQALEALEEGDGPELDLHLATCVECRMELSELREAASLLAFAATEIEPPAALRSRILESVRPQSSSHAANVDRTANFDRAAGFDRQPEAKSSLIPLASRPGRHWSFAQGFAALAAALAFVALLASLFVLWNRNAALHREIAQLENQAAGQQRILAHEREAVALLTAQDAAKQELAGTPMAQKAHAMLAYDRQTGRAMLMVEGLPAAPADKGYQLWFIANGHPMPGKVFTIDASGKAMMSDQVPAEARQHAVFAVTLEPRNGVSAPTGDIYLRSPAS
ncbi:MAG: anti-sigma factor [Pyrinomonadaceae bacterium]